MAMPRSLGSCQVTLRPPIQIWPSSTSIRPAMALSRVDLPQPDGPSSTRNSRLRDLEIQPLEDTRRAVGDLEAAERDVAAPVHR